MCTYSVADAKNRLSYLIDRALEGEAAVITRHARAVVELKAVPEPARPVSSVELDWLAKHRIGRSPAAEGAGVFLTKLRDEEER
jgi:antitoxin (DNA-binding transcriptional repressor) of toxin-antitoxin stability system